ncbi:MAG: Type prenyl endopeptidase Rce1-like [Actinomycetota bacterium]|nr:Type prenyl endopeptidase Rce1-like [Actinomycetota bacterium]
MSQPVALRRTSIDAAIVAGLLLLVPFRLMLVGLTIPRTLILLACYGAIGGLSMAATKKVTVHAHLGPLTAVAIGVAAVGAASLWAGPAPARSLDAVAVVLGIAAAISEEALFRGLLFQRLERFGAMAAVVIGALVFALVHVPLYGTAAFSVDFAAGLLLGWQRWATGGWGASATTHAVANVLAVLR